MHIERLLAADYVVQPSQAFVDVYSIHEYFDALAHEGRPLALIGPKGIGKSLAVHDWALKNKWPLVTCDCSEDLRRTNLIGMTVLRGGETPFVLGPIPTAIEVANEAGSCILDLEEMNALSPQMQKILNPITDWRRRIEVPECKSVFALKPGAKLWVVATMNTTEHGGVYDLNQDLKSRFRCMELGYPSKKLERQLVVANLKARGVDMTTEVIGFLTAALTLAEETRNKSLDYALSPRDVVQVMEDFLSLGSERALRLLLGKFEGADQTTIEERIFSTFAVKPRGKKKEEALA